MFKKIILSYDIDTETWVIYAIYFFVFRRTIGIYNNATDAINAARIL